MHIELQLPDLSNIQLLQRTYDLEADDIRSILIDVCRSIEHQGQFVISGFGQDRWPVDVGTDLVVFLEQQPGVLSAINSGRAAELDFYEQGVERTISFAPSSDHYVMSCASQLAWKPHPNIEQIDRASLQ